MCGENAHLWVDAIKEETQKNKICANCFLGNHGDYF